MLHIVGCVLFLSIPIVAALHKPDDFADNSFYVNEIVEYALTIVFFYLNYYYLIPQFYFRKRYFLFVLFALLGFIVVNTLPELLPYNTHQQIAPHFDEHFPPPPMDRDEKIPFTNLTWRELGPIDENFLKYSVVFILAMTLKITHQLKKTQKEKADAELMFLKSQINPHFLFNTLNSIYTLAVESNADTTAKAIAQLSVMMRYSINEAFTETVFLSSDLKYIDNYIALQRLRLNPSVNLIYLVEGNPGNKKIAPFLLMPFIENAFKYGVSTTQDATIRIQIQIIEDTLMFKVVNTKFYPAKTKELGTSIGIENTRKRLELLYSGRNTFTINDEGTIFEISMQINL